VISIQNIIGASKCLYHPWLSQVESTLPCHAGKAQEGCTCAACAASRSLTNSSQPRESPSSCSTARQPARNAQAARPPPRWPPARRRARPPTAAPPAAGTPAREAAGLPKAAPLNYSILKYQLAIIGTKLPETAWAAGPTKAFGVRAQQTSKDHSRAWGIFDHCAAVGSATAPHGGGALNLLNLVSRAIVAMPVTMPVTRAANIAPRRGSRGEI
jgi:hypothetical protein